MKSNGILPGRNESRATLRIQSIEPLSAEMTSAQIGVIADIAEKYGSGQVHVTPRQTIEIPDVERAYIDEIHPMLNRVGLYTGSAGNYLRNVVACSKWCLFNAVPVSDLAQKLNKLYHQRELPGKTAVSLSGCNFSCTRSRTSDIGVIARRHIEVNNDNICVDCKVCIRAPLGCQMDAITLAEKAVFIDESLCIECGFCTTVCRPESIQETGTSFDILLGGSGGFFPREASFYKNVPTEEATIAEIDAVFDQYTAVAQTGERLGQVMERLGTDFLLEVQHG